MHVNTENLLEFTYFFQTDVAMTSIILYQDDQYFPRGKEFLPERWLKEPSSGCPSGKDTHRFLFLPFGFGPRACIGLRMANLELEMIVARVVRQYEVRWNYDDFRLVSNLINAPANELRYQMVEVDH